MTEEISNDFPRNNSDREQEISGKAPNFHDLKSSINSQYKKSVSFINPEEQWDEVDEQEVIKDKINIINKKIAQLDSDESEVLDVNNSEDEEEFFDQVISQEAKKDEEIAKRKVMNNKKEEADFFDETEGLDLFELISKKNKHEAEIRKRNEAEEESFIQIKNRDKIDKSKLDKQKSSSEDGSFFDLPSFLKKKK